MKSRVCLRWPKPPPPQKKELGSQPNNSPHPSLGERRGWRVGGGASPSAPSVPGPPWGYLSRRGSARGQAPAVPLQRPLEVFNVFCSSEALREIHVEEMGYLAGRGLGWRAEDGGGSGAGHGDHTRPKVPESESRSGE